jgi:FkbM family methyltransferase
MKSYSQHGEDVWCAANLTLPDVGIFAEVGAANGVENSNTLWLEQRGWTGLVVEPDARQYPALYDARNPNRCCICPVACGVPLEREGEMRDFSLTSNPTHSGFLRQNGRREAVPVYSLGYLCQQFRLPNNTFAIPKLDFLSIDTEGTELDVWDSLPAAMRPPVVIIEWSTEGLGVADNSAAVIERMQGDGYGVVHRTACNLIFVRKP